MRLALEIADYRFELTGWELCIRLNRQAGALDQQSSAAASRCVRTTGPEAARIRVNGLQDEAATGCAVIPISPAAES